VLSGGDKGREREGGRGEMRWKKVKRKMKNMRGERNKKKRKGRYRHFSPFYPIRSQEKLFCQMFF
jgi:hypothetical protein